ncbi:MAG: STAS domain-containing protein [Sphingomonas adhaesiva]|uniref:STAS domain-containing protein n=1 Tax=Sphingomonas adhaesiva TaxID=28212 RepID=UPI002FF5B2C6
MPITTVTAAEDLCLPTIGTLAQTLRDALTAGASVRLDLSGVAAPDLSVLQLVQSARATAAQAGGALTLTAPAGAALRAVLERAGFLTRLSTADSEFWFHGDTAQ